MMARPAELGVERRESSGAAGTSARNHADTDAADAATKYRPPVAARALLARDRLIEVLRAAVGDGSSSFTHRPIRQEHACRAVARRTRARRRWGGLADHDEDDNNAVWFLVHLLEPIRAGLA